MPTSPSTTTRSTEQASAAFSGDERLLLLSPVPANADMQPRQFGGPRGLFDFHGYCPAVEFLSHFAPATRKPVLFIGLPIDTPGTVSRVDTSGNKGTSTVSVAAGSDGVLYEHEGVVKVRNGGTVGTDQIVLEVSLDGGRNFSPVRVGTASSYAPDYAGVSLSFAAGTLVAGDTVATWTGTNPRASAARYTTARENYEAQSKTALVALNVVDCVDVTEANALRDFGALLDTGAERDTMFRGSVYDRAPLAKISAVSARMTGSPTLTFADGAPDTITRSAGSFIADGFQVGDTVTISGTASNDGDYEIDALTATEIETTGLTAEGPVSDAVAIARTTLTFDAGGTITRSKGSWLDDGFRAADVITINGTASNDADFTIDSLTATELTLATNPVNETIRVDDPDRVVAGQTIPEWAAEVDAAFAGVNQEHVNLSGGRGRRGTSPWSGFDYRLPASWIAAVAEFGDTDIHVPIWKRDAGLGVTLTNAAGQLEEYDDRVHGGALVAGRFTCLTTQSNGTQVYFARDLTRADEASLMINAASAKVIFLIKALVQDAAQKAATGQTLILKTDGSGEAEPASLSEIESMVQPVLDDRVLANVKGFGPRASGAKFECSRDDVYNIPEPTMTTTTRVTLNGIVHTIINNIAIQR